MASQTIRNRCKQRAVGTKGGLDRGLNEPNLSGAYIRSLVKQITSSRSHASFKSEAPPQNAVQKVRDSGLINGNSTIATDYEKSFNGTYKPDVSSSNPSVLAAASPQKKKQVRRRPHTRKTSQDCLLNIAEARREIVTALHLHRAAVRNARDQKSDTNNNNISSNHNITYSQSKEGNSSCTTPTSTARCNSCIFKGSSQKGYNEAKAITICGHLLCCMCLSEYLIYLSAWPVKECMVCSRYLTANDIFPITLGVPILHDQSFSAASCTTGVSSVLQSAPLLLINPLPAPQPAWSTTAPSMIPMDGIFSTKIQQGTPTILEDKDDSAANSPFTMASPVFLTPNDVHLDLPDEESILSINWHQAMDEEEMAQIRFLDEQYAVEWSEYTLNNDSLQNILEEPMEEVGFDPQFLEDPILNSMNENLYFSSDLYPLESLWSGELFDYHDWMQDLKNRDVYDEVHEIQGSEVLKNNENKCCNQELSDDTTDLHSDVSSDNPDNNAEVSVGDKRKRDYNYS